MNSTTILFVLEGFYGKICYLSSLGKIWGSAGLKDMIVNSDVYTEVTVDMILQGKEFNRGIHAFILSYETLSQLRCEEFLEWIQENKHVISQSVWDQLITTRDLIKTSVKPTAALAELERLVVELIYSLFSVYRDTMSKSNPTFHIWNMFLDAAQLFLNSMRADRIGNWGLHLHYVLSKLKYYKGANKPNYTRWTPAYLLDMILLPASATEAFEKGESTVWHTKGSFNAVPTDMATEHHIKEMKGPGGVKNVTRNEPALVRWSLIRHVTGKYSAKLTKRIHSVDKKEQKHLEEEKAALKCYEQDINQLLSHIHSNMINPFNKDREHVKVLINISTGLHANITVQNFLLNCVKHGQEYVDVFIHGVFDKSSDKNFHDPIK